jgi:hypothetical protein
MAEDGFTAIETSVAVVTSTFADPVIPPALAVMLAEPAWTAVMTPVALTVTTALLDELQVTVSVISLVESSL